MRLCALIFLLPFLLFFGEVAEARTYCPLPEDGIWINPDAESKQLARLEIETKCINDEVQARVRAFTKCIPRDCKWGWTKAEVLEGGGLRVLLIGFLTSKIIDLSAFGDSLTAYVTNLTNDDSYPRTTEAYTLKRR
jgi:hypothetical protein